MADTCKIRIETGFMSSHACGRPVKDEGLCGIHLAAKRKREANDRKARQKDDESSFNRESAEALLAEVRAVYPDAQGSAEYSWRSGVHTGSLVLRPETVRALLALARGEELPAPVQKLGIGSVLVPKAEGEDRG